jgi:hypothetical protein
MQMSRVGHGKACVALDHSGHHNRRRLMRQVNSGRKPAKIMPTHYHTRGVRQAHSHHAQAPEVTRNDLPSAAIWPPPSARSSVITRPRSSTDKVALAIISAELASFTMQPFAAAALIKRCFADCGTACEMGAGIACGIGKNTGGATEQADTPTKHKRVNLRIMRLLSCSIFDAGLCNGKHVT